MFLVLITLLCFSKRVCLLVFCFLGLAVSAQERHRSGTAFAVTSNGHLVTSAHLVRDHELIRAFSAQSGRALRIKVLAIDEADDLALLNITDSLVTKPIPIADFSGVPTGLEIFVLGFPLPSFQGRELKVTSGIISSRSGLRDNPGSFQFSAPIQGGNSGGPVVAVDGSVVGVVHGKLMARPRESQRPVESPQNVNLATDSNKVADFLAGQGVHVIRRTTNLSKVLRPHEVFEQLKSSIYFLEIKYAATKVGPGDMPVRVRQLLSGISEADEDRLLKAYFEGFTEVLRGAKQVLLLRPALDKTLALKKNSRTFYEGVVEATRYQMIISFNEPQKFKGQFSYQSVVLEMAYDCENNTSTTLYREYKEFGFAGGATRLKLLRKPSATWDPSIMKPVKSGALINFFNSHLCQSK